jgi:hypothetical protein
LRPSKDGRSPYKTRDSFELYFFALGACLVVNFQYTAAVRSDFRCLRHPAGVVTLVNTSSKVFLRIIDIYSLVSFLENTKSRPGKAIVYSDRYGTSVATFSVAEQVIVSRSGGSSNSQFTSQ